MKRSRDGKDFSFAEFTQADLARQFVGGQDNLCFDMSRLEEDIDYETDENMIRRAKRTLDTDLFNTVDFMVRDNPLLLVTNFE